ncbi:hypothetical protein GA0070607_5767 [Micromonospora coriariae]|uniref:Uncharacterized protein n=1 Tax=Micromonospora coriariae TaxID=285665 RepID=A0A1C4XTZ7_9ACTN|nr:hypothetical protein [Micromonospora coriariae]SCF11979.1 hypothetical protein GA0070607_5767 [Micromonospora coriariae]
MWQPPTPAEQELWNAVVAGVRAVNQMDHGRFRASVVRLLRLPNAWTHEVLRDTAELLVDELDPDGKVDRRLLAALLPDGHRPPVADVPGEPALTRHGLLLIAQLADAAQVNVGAFVDVALAMNRRAEGTVAASVPHCRIGR